MNRYKRESLLGEPLPLPYKVKAVSSSRIKEEPLTQNPRHSKDSLSSDVPDLEALRKIVVGKIRDRQASGEAKRHVSEVLDSSRPSSRYQSGKANKIRINLPTEQAQLKPIRMQETQNLLETQSRNRPESLEQSRNQPELLEQSHDRQYIHLMQNCPKLIARIVLQLHQIESKIELDTPAIDSNIASASLESISAELDYVLSSLGINDSSIHHLEQFQNEWAPQDVTLHNKQPVYEKEKNVDYWDSIGDGHHYDHRDDIGDDIRNDIGDANSDTNSHVSANKPSIYGDVLGVPNDPEQYKFETPNLQVVPYSSVTKWAIVAAFIVFLFSSFVVSGLTYDYCYYFC